MKNLFIILVFLTFITCKKDEVDPPVVTPDYADSLVGTYLGQEVRFQQDNSTQEYNNGSKTMTVTKLDKNRIQVTSFNSGLSPKFTLSDRGDGNIKLTPEGIAEYGTGNNEYFISPSKQLYIYLVTGSGSATRYYSYQATKQ